MAEASFGEWLKRQRSGRGLTQVQLSQQIGCAAITLRKIESEERRPSAQVVERLAEIFNIPAEERGKFLRFARGDWTLAPAMSSDDSPWRGASDTTPGSNLPFQLSSFVGRSRELLEIAGLMTNNRLTTLVGPGGVGKTRLSLKTGEQVLKDYAHGVWFVELAPISDPLLLPRTIAMVIGLQDEPQRPVTDMLSDYLLGKKMLIILDNCEHVLDACAQIADILLKKCPHLKILATSRQALGIVGEAVYQVPSLQGPNMEQIVEDFRTYESVRLFEERARLVKTNFSLIAENISSIAKICTRLDGIPLAIELAAARVDMFSIEQIAERLHENFELLIGGSRTALPRHQTLQAAIDWSFDLLSTHEQIIFQRLSVFVHGWTLEAAQAVASDKKIKPEEVVDLLAQLIKKSLVHTKEQQSPTRYQMLETIRQYAHEKLVRSGKSLLLKDRHLDYFLRLAEIAAPHLIRSEQLEWLAQLDADYENLRAALEWSLSKESAELSLRLCSGLGRYWDLRTFWLEGSQWLSRALSKANYALTSAEKIALANALREDVELANQLDDLQRMKISAEQCFTIAQEVSDQRGIAIAKFEVGNMLYRHGDNENALPFLEQSYDELQVLNDPYWQACVYQQLIELVDSEGKITYSEKIKRLETSVKLARLAGERLKLAELLNTYSSGLYSQNQLDEAMKFAKEADLLYKQIAPNLNSTPFVFTELAWLRDDYKEVERYYMEIAERYRLIGEKNERALIIQRLGQLALEQGDLDQAQMYFEEALATAREVSGNIFIASRLGALGITYYLQGKRDLCRRCLREAIFMLKGLKEISLVARYILLLTVIHINIPDLKIVAKLLGAIDFSQQERPITPLTLRYYARAVTLAREKLGDAAFELAFAEGQKMLLYEALDLALKTVEEF